MKQTIQNSIQFAIKDTIRVYNVYIIFKNILITSKCFLCIVKS